MESDRQPAWPRHSGTKQQATEHQDASHCMSGEWRTKASGTTSSGNAPWSRSASRKRRAPGSLRTSHSKARAQQTLAQKVPLHAEPHTGSGDAQTEGIRDPSTKEGTDMVFICKAPPATWPVEEAARSEPRQHMRRWASFALKRSGAGSTTLQKGG